MIYVFVLTKACNIYP